ncbi:MAG: hypothetical protein ACRDEA_12830 [Microcystaceae cyanobacterium]
MTIKEAEALGYKVIKASPFEVGLTRNGQGIRTWWASDFGGKLPGLDHSLIQEAIVIHNKIESDFLLARDNKTREQYE